MDQKTAESGLGKRVRIILTNNFHYSGILLDCDKTSLTIRDKFSNKVTLTFQSIMLFEVTTNGD